MRAENLCARAPRVNHVIRQLQRDHAPIRWERGENEGVVASSLFLALLQCLQRS